MDYEKIRILVDVEDDNDPKVHQLIYIIMREYVDREKNWICFAKTPGDGELFGVISLGEESFSEDLEELNKMDIPVPEYLTKLKSARYRSRGV